MKEFRKMRRNYNHLMKGELGQSWKRLNKKGKILLAICIAEAVFIMGLIFLFAFITGAFN